MEALILHHHPHPLCSSIHFYCSSLTPTFSSSSFFLSTPQSSSITASLSDPPLQFPQPKFPQFPNPLRKIPSFVTVTAASALFFIGFYRNGFIKKPMAPPLSSAVSIQDEEKNRVGADSVLLHLKLEGKVPIVHGFNRTETDDEKAWQVLKAEVFRSSEGFEFVKIGFEEILERERTGYHDSVLERLEVVDKCKRMLKGIKVGMERCERENANVKHSLMFFTKVVAQIRVLEADMLSALKYYKELDKN
ncbi:hypothetical protein RJT34_16138 [Clitoria ternatea]|uniref:Uncharacterized protein n=1 Tax=Clitoria ternatea TaxID=43366 RepID=A0AAN9J6M9_CLITE